MNNKLQESIDRLAETVKIGTSHTNLKTQLAKDIVVVLDRLNKYHEALEYYADDSHWLGYSFIGETINGVYQYGKGKRAAIALSLTDDKCKHGKGLTDYCEPCGRING